MNRRLLIYNDGVFMSEYPPRLTAVRCRDYLVTLSALRPGSDVFGFWAQPFRAVHITDAELGLQYD